MIRVQKSSDGKLAVVSGLPCEIMLYYCLWQSQLWPDWMDHEKFGDDSDHATRQHKRVIEAVSFGRELLMNDQHERFEVARWYAIDKCRALGIQVSTESLSEHETRVG